VRDRRCRKYLAGEQDQHERRKHELFVVGTGNKIHTLVLIQLKLLDMQR
jgi:hypothetical protein